MYLRFLRSFSKVRAGLAAGPLMALALLAVPPASANETGVETDVPVDDNATVAAAPGNAANVTNMSATVVPVALTPALEEPGDRSESNELADGDVRFRNLFANWSALDAVPEQLPGMVASAGEPLSVSIPSLIPVRGARMSSGFGMRNHPVLRRRRHHSGIDLAAPTGTPIYASASGIVGRADWFSSYGLFISINHGAELQTRYAHLSRLAVAAGDLVEKGELIGYVGSTGRSTGPHLHYEVRVDGVAVNPIPYMMTSDGS